MRVVMAEEPPGISWYLITAAIFLALPILDRLFLQPANDPSMISFFLNILLLVLTVIWALNDGVRFYDDPDGYDATGLAALLGVIIGTTIVFLWIPWN